MNWFGLGWVGLGWFGLGWVGLVGLGWVGLVGLVLNQMCSVFQIVLHTAHK